MPPAKSPAKSSALTILLLPGAALVILLTVLGFKSRPENAEPTAKTAPARPIALAHVASAEALKPELDKVIRENEELVRKIEEAKTRATQKPAPATIKEPRQWAAVDMRLLSALGNDRKTAGPAAGVF